MIPDLATPRLPFQPRRSEGPNHQRHCHNHAQPIAVFLLAADFTQLAAKRKRVEASINIGATISGGSAFPIEEAGLVGNWLIRADTVPEPSTWAMMGLGVGLLAGFCRFRRRTS